MYIRQRGDNMRAACLSDALKGTPAAWVELNRTHRAPYLHGKIQFYPWSRGALVKSEFVNLPVCGCYQIQFQPIHGSEVTPIRHMPKFYAENGYALLLFYIDRIQVEELIGREVALTAVSRDSEKNTVIGSGAVQNKKIPDLNEPA